MRSSDEHSKNSFISILRPIVIGCLIGSIICAVLLVVVTFAFVQSKHLPKAVIDWISLSICAISAFFSGYFAAKISNEKGLLCGVLSALLLFLLMFISSFSVSNDAVTAVMLTKLLIMVIIGAIGGIIAVNKKAKIK